MKRVMSLILAVCMCLSATGAVLGADETKTLAEEILAKGKREINLGYWSEAADSYGAGHVQGVCVDDAGKYMYASLTNMLVKVDVTTGEIVGSMVGLSTGSHKAGAHIGDVCYDNGKIYTPLIYNASEMFYIGVIDGEKITGMDMPYTTPGLMQALYVPQVKEAFCNEMGAGEHGNYHTSMGHRYGCSGIDGIAVGKLPGGGYDTDGDGVMDVSNEKPYLFVLLGHFMNAKRYDNENLIILAYDLESATEQNLLPFTEELLTKEYTGEESFLYQHKLFCYVGNQSYGAQQLEVDRDTGDIWLECYRSDSGKEFPNVTRFAIDGSIPLYMDIVEVGQSVTGDSDGFISQAEAHARAACYTDYEDTDGDGDYHEQEPGWHMTLKCLCGNDKTLEDHEEVSHGVTGHPARVCGAASVYCTGLTSLGDDLYYAVTNTTTYKDGVGYYGGLANLVKLNRNTFRFEGVGNPYIFRDFEEEFQEGEGALGSKNAKLVSVTSSSFADTSYPVFKTPSPGDNLYLSAWVKIDNTELTDDTVSFILWAGARVHKTAENENLSDTDIVSSYVTVKATDTGLKKGEWVQVSAVVENWNGKVRGTIPAGYQNVTEDTKDAIDEIICFEEVSIRLNGTSYAKENVSAVNYYIDDFSFYAAPQSVNTEAGSSEVFGGSALDSQADVNCWRASGTKAFVSGNAPDGSSGYMRLGDGTNTGGEIRQEVTLKPNHLYKVSFWVKVEQATDDATTGGIRFFQNAKTRIADKNGFNTNYPGVTLENVLTTEWQKFEYYYLQERKTFTEQKYNTSFRFFWGTDSNALSKCIFGVDDIHVVDMGEVTNGDFAYGGAQVYRNNGTYTYNVLGWTENGANAEVNNGALMITATKDGGKVYQGINMKNGGTYKLSFRAKTTTGEKPLAVVLDRKVSVIGGDSEVYQVPDYQYITGTNEVNTEYTAGDWKVTEDWQTFECYIQNEFPLIAGKTVTTGIIPRTPYLYFDVDGNKAGTQIFIDDVSLTQVSTLPVISRAEVLGENKPGATLTFQGAYSSPKGNDVSVMVKALLKDGETCASVGTMYVGDTFVVPEHTIGKELVFAFTPVDSEGLLGETVYVTPYAADGWAKLYLDEKTMTARAYAACDTNAEVIFVSYKDGALMDIEVVPVSMTAETKAIADGSALMKSNADTIKVMLWNSAEGVIPLCESIQIE